MNSAADWYADTEQRERVEKSKRISNADRIRQMTNGSKIMNKYESGRNYRIYGE